MLRVILGVVAGIITGMVTVSVVQAVGHQLYPVAVNFDLKDQAQMRALVAGMPFGALAFVVFAWISGAYMGSMVGLLIGARKRIAGIIPAAVMLLATIANLFMIPHPAWMAVVGISGILLAAWLADALFAKQT